MPRFLISPLLALSLFCSITASATPADDLNTLFDDYWQFELREDPFMATSSGVYQYNHEVPQVAPQDQRRRTDARRVFMERLATVDLMSLSAEERLSADLLQFILKHDLTLAEFDSWRIPVLADGGFHSDIGYVVSATPFRGEEDYRAYLHRLTALPAYLDQNIENMKTGLADRFTQPAQILPLILPSFEAQVTASAEAHPLYAPFESMPADWPEELRRQLATEATVILESKVIPAYARALEFVRDDYLPGAINVVGASNLPDGERYYAALVRYFTTLDDATPSSIHALGISEVARIRGEMDKVIEDTGFEGTFDEFLEFLRTDPQFYASTAEELLKEAAYISKRIDGRLPAFFKKLPRQPYSVEPVPDAIAQNYTTGRYIPAAPDSDRGGQYWVNTYALDTRPLYQLPALTLHEAVPGHHLQGALSYEIEGAPQFRTQFYPHAFGEGWGLYAEKLGVEMGIYRTPYEHFGRLSYEMWRACRLVIDTGLHAKHWTRQQAMDYLSSNTALSLHNVQTEVDRYIAWPGQALAYKMGELTIWELRDQAQSALGTRFDVREFHDAVLTGGGLPLDLLRERISRYIASVQQEEL
jgi:uncharacterized protein (DUF885 family)